jgi:hypothetical protein
MALPAGWNWLADRDNAKSAWNVPHYGRIKRAGGRDFSVVIFAFLRGMPDKLSVYACTHHEPLLLLVAFIESSIAAASGYIDLSSSTDHEGSSKIMALNRVVAVPQPREVWWARMDLNHQPADYESDALTS